MAITSTKELKRNELHGGFGEMPKSSIVRDVRIGDLVELFVYEQFSQGIEKHERYAGYVASISYVSISLSPTHHENRRHGYIPGEKSKDRVTTEIETFRVREYSLLE